MYTHNGVPATDESNINYAHTSVSGVSRHCNNIRYRLFSWNAFSIDRRPKNTRARAIFRAFQAKERRSRCTRRFARPTNYHNNTFIDFKNNTHAYIMYRDACPAYSARINNEGAVRPSNLYCYTVVRRMRIRAGIRGRVTFNW